MDTGEEKGVIAELLARYREARGNSLRSLAAATDCHYTHISRLEDRTKSRGISPQLAQRFHQVLRFGEMDERHPELVEADRVAWYRATHLAEIEDGLVTDGGMSRKQLLIGAASLAVAPRSGTTDKKVTNPQSPLELELPLDVLVEIGVTLVNSHHSADAIPLLTRLVGRLPDGLLIQELRRTSDIRTRCAATVASAYLGHCYLNRHDPHLTQAYFQYALDLLNDEDQPLHRWPQKAWERWQMVTGRSLVDLRLWCSQMIGVAQRMIGGKRNVADAQGWLRHVATQAPRLQRDANGMRGNALRDLALAKIAINPAADQVRQDLNEAVALLSSVEDSTMLVVTLLKRASWHKARGEIDQMDLDVRAGVELPHDALGTVHLNILNTVAGIYADVEPALARRLAEEAVKQAEDRGLDGQVQRAQATLRRLGVVDKEG